MTQPLQTKDAHWRGRRRNGATPVFDPGLSPLGTDEEAGGAIAPVADRDGVDRPPMQASPDDGGPGPRLTPTVWYAAAVAIGAVILITGLASIP